MSSTDTLDHLQQVHELNRAFLGLLQSRLADATPSFGLPAAAELTVRQASSEVLDAVARFPQALFRLVIARHGRRALVDPGAHCDEAEHDLVLSMLLAGRHVSRHSIYQARLLFGLMDEEIQALSQLPLADAQKLAGTPETVQCAFRDRVWFWQGLFTATRPELRHQLTLMALQPGVIVTWPRRRPPRASA
jgi:hypothetical protein